MADNETMNRLWRKTVIKKGAFHQAPLWSDQSIRLCSCQMKN